MQGCHSWVKALRLFLSPHRSGVRAEDGMHLMKCWFLRYALGGTAAQLHGALSILTTVAHGLWGVRGEINEYPIRVGVCRLQHLSNYGFWAGWFAGRRGGCTLAEIGHCGRGLCSVEGAGGMQDGWRQKRQVYGARSRLYNTWEWG